MLHHFTFWGVTKGVVVFKGVEGKYFLWLGPRNRKDFYAAH